MIKFIVKYAINKSIFKRVLIEAATITQAYLLFLIKYPREYEITDIKEEKSPAEA